MKVLLINGSPKGKNSNSLRLADSFLEGIRLEQEAAEEEMEVFRLNISELRIEACRGCFACWKSTPGICCIKDDMQLVIEKQLWADLIVWSFPLYYFNVPGMLKNLIDRQLPMNLPFMSSRVDGYGSGSHASRYDMAGKRHVLISTCGFYSAEGNYDSVLPMFDHFLGKGNYTVIFCGQGELFRVKELSKRTDEYLGTVFKAGKEYARKGNISKQTENALHKLLYPREVFEEMADASWGLCRDTGAKEPEDLQFTRQMAALYNQSAYDGRDRVLEICYTDLEHTYQILLGRDGSKVYTDGSLAMTTRIDTAFGVWKSIAKGEINGAEALGKHMYSVTGELDLMIHWGKFFGSQKTAEESVRDMEEPDGRKHPVMATMLIPWITFWVAVSIHSGMGSLLTLGVIAIFAPIAARVPICYLGFGFLWRGSSAVGACECNRKRKRSDHCRLPCLWADVADFL